MAHIRNMKALKTEWLFLRGSSLRLPRKPLKAIIRLVFVVLSLIVVFPYMKAELNTWLHGAEFRNLYKSTGMIEGIEYFRVLDYSATHSKVFYVSTDHVAGNLLIFSKTDSGWVLDHWETVWSRSGSASKLTWPYYP